MICIHLPEALHACVISFVCTSFLYSTREWDYCCMGISTVVRDSILEEDHFYMKRHIYFFVWKLDLLKGTIRIYEKSIQRERCGAFFAQASIRIGYFFKSLYLVRKQRMVPLNSSACWFGRSFKHLVLELQLKIALIVFLWPKVIFGACTPTLSAKSAYCAILAGQGDVVFHVNAFRIPPHSVSKSRLPRTLIQPSKIRSMLNEPSSALLARSFWHASAVGTIRASTITRHKNKRNTKGNTAWTKRGLSQMATDCLSGWLLNWSS